MKWGSTCRGGVRTDCGTLRCCGDQGAPGQGPAAPSPVCCGCGCCSQRPLGCSRASPCPPVRARGLQSRRGSTLWAAVMVHGEFPWQVLSCHLAQVLKGFFFFCCVHRGKYHQSSRGSDLPWSVDWADMALFGGVSSQLFRSCFSRCVLIHWRWAGFYFAFQATWLMSYPLKFCKKSSNFSFKKHALAINFQQLSPDRLLKLWYLNAERNLQQKGQQKSPRPCWQLCITLRKQITIFLNALKKNTVYDGFDPVSCCIYICVHGVKCLHFYQH